MADKADVCDMCYIFGCVHHKAYNYEVCPVLSHEGVSRTGYEFSVHIEASLSLLQINC
jgi:hypothetical protein